MKTPAAPSLSVAQLLVLATAAQRPDRMVLPLPEGLRVRGATQRSLLGGMLRAGLAEEVPVDEVTLCWRTEAGGQRFGLRVTSFGMAALESDRSGVGSAADEAPAPVPQPMTGPAGAKGQADGGPATGPYAAQAAREIPNDASVDDSAFAATRRDPEVGADRSSAAVADPTPAPAASRPRGKLGRVLDAVSTTDGATLAEIVVLTGWQPHTARAALTGLRRRGLAVALTTDAAGRKAYRACQGRPA